MNKVFKEIRKESLRDNMTDIEIALTALGKIATRELANVHKPYGLEQKLGKSVISNKNSLNYMYIDEPKQIKNNEYLAKYLY